MPTRNLQHNHLSGRRQRTLDFLRRAGQEERGCRGPPIPSCTAPSDRLAACRRGAVSNPSAPRTTTGSFGPRASGSREPRVRPRPVGVPGPGRVVRRGVGRLLCWTPVEHARRADEAETPLHLLYVPEPRLTVEAPGLRDRQAHRGGEEPARDAVDVQDGVEAGP
jgi:hypothetical protein